MADAGSVPGDLPRAILIEDEEPLARLLVNYLVRAGFAVRAAHDGPTGLRAIRELEPEIVVLDLGLPGMDGLEVCRQVRTFSDCYILMLTARTEEADTLLGLSVGADDYMTKPFSPRELIARIAALRRRPLKSAQSTPPLRSWGDLSVDTAGREVRWNGHPIDLTRTEFDILMVLADEPNKVMTREGILDHVWGPGWVGDAHVVDVHIAHIRRKLGEAGGSPQCIRSVRGVGYRLGEPQ
ncbi:MAG: response regulator transcription factor [Propionibacteriaceae bacterium]|jgi:DNA-binding response OmpR family regulator|nr:response regulator transcription factor [Propionibacteriaceae bacterium]